MPPLSSSGLFSWELRLPHHPRSPLSVLEFFSLWADQALFLRHRDHLLSFRLEGEMLLRILPPIRNYDLLLAAAADNPGLEEVVG